MQPFQRPQFICSAIEQCKETVNCCLHKQPHIKDERCVPRECRYAPGVENIDCVRYPQVTPTVPDNPVEQKIKEKNEAEEAKIQKEVPELEEPAQEQDIKDAVKKQAVSAKSPGKKKARRS